MKRHGSVETELGRQTIINLVLIGQIVAGLTFAAINYMQQGIIPGTSALKES